MRNYQWLCTGDAVNNNNRRGEFSSLAVEPVENVYFYLQTVGYTGAASCGTRCDAITLN